MTVSNGRLQRPRSVAIPSTCKSSIPTDHAQAMNPTIIHKDHQGMARRARIAILFFPVLTEPLLLVEFSELLSIGFVAKLVIDRVRVSCQIDRAREDKLPGEPGKHAQKCDP
jgi:hypothetical protein